MSIRSKLSRQLSIIQESHGANERLIYVVLGPGSRTIITSTLQTATDVFPALAADASASAPLEKSASWTRKNRSAGNSQKSEKDMGKIRSMESMVSKATDRFGDGDDVSCQFYIDGHRELEERNPKVHRQTKAEYEAAKLAQEVVSNIDAEDVDAKKKATSRIGSIFNQTAARTSNVSRTSKKSNGRFSFLSRTSRCSDASNITEVPRKVIKATWIAVEKFSECVPSCPTAVHFKQVCMVFLIDERQAESESDVLSDLQFRKAEIERWIKASLEKFQLVKLPPMLAVVLVHKQPTSRCNSLQFADGSLQLPQGAFRDCTGSRSLTPSIVEVPTLPGNCKTLQTDQLKVVVPSPSPYGGSEAAFEPQMSGRSKMSIDSWSAARGMQGVTFSPPEGWKYAEFADGVQKMVQDDHIQYSCNFDDGEALLDCIVRLSALILQRRSDEEGMDLKPRVSQDPGFPDDSACCNCCSNNNCCKCQCVVS